MSERGTDQVEFEEIESYVLGTMSEADRTRFGLKLETVPGLREEVALHREHTLAIELGAFSRELERVSLEYPVETSVIPITRKSGRLFTVLSIAASVAILVGLFGWFLVKPSVNEQILAEYHLLDPGLPVPMSATGNAQFHDAMVDYKMGSFEKAISKWNALLVQNPGNDTLRFYIANAQIGQGHIMEAQPLLENLVNGSGTAFQSKAQWRLFLSYVQEGNNEKVQAMVPLERSEYAERIKAIQQRLEK